MSAGLLKYAVVLSLVATPAAFTIGGHRQTHSRFLSVTTSDPVAPSAPSRNLESLEWRPEGYETWTWRNKEENMDIKVNYVVKGLGKPGTPIVLVHGFGASAFHWRYNIPALAEDRPVYALDLVGFGLTDKPLVTYSPELWRDQVGAFLSEVVQAPAVVAGNSLGGFTALYTAASFPDLTASCILLNAAGRFSASDKMAAGEEASAAPNGEAPPESTLAGLLDAAKKLFTKAAIYGGFFLTKQPTRISQVLRQVYPVDDSNVDDALVESIRFPADTSPNCAEVFYRVVTRTSDPKLQRPSTAIDDLLPLLTAHATPLWLVWGEKDPWIRPAVADRIEELKPDAVRVSINAGHCPHDEAPREVNAALSRAAAQCDGLEK